jgi:hypothetical protein
MTEVFLSIRSTIVCAGIGAVLSLAATLAQADQPQPPRSDATCFLAADWSSWKSPSANVIYLRVNMNQVYELDLSAGSNQLQGPDMHLVSVIRGSDWICSPLDLQLEVADSHGGFREPLIVKSITRLTPDQVKAIPARYRP